MKCSGCFKLIEETDPYFSGHWIPEANQDGYRKFGCSPQQNYCKTCMQDMPTFFNQPERSKREDFYQNLAKDYLNEQEHWEIDHSEKLSIECFAKYLDRRCGALNTTAT